jgi:hypothetical protein
MNGYTIIGIMLKNIICNNKFGSGFKYDLSLEKALQMDNIENASKNTTAIVNLQTNKEIHTRLIKI